MKERKAKRVEKRMAVAGLLAIIAIIPQQWRFNQPVVGPLLSLTKTIIQATLWQAISNQGLWNYWRAKSNLIPKLMAARAPIYPRWVWLSFKRYDVITFKIVRGVFGAFFSARSDSSIQWVLPGSFQNSWRDFTISSIFVSQNYFYEWNYVG